MIPQGCVVPHINTTTATLSVLRSSNLLNTAHDNKKHLRLAISTFLHLLYGYSSWGKSVCVNSFRACVLLVTVVHLYNLSLPYNSLHPKLLLTSPSICPNSSSYPTGDVLRIGPNISFSKLIFFNSYLM